MYLYKSFEILVKHNKKLKNANVLFLRRNQNSVILSTCLESDLKRFPVPFWSVHVNLVQNRGSYRTISFVSNWMCFLRRYSTRLYI